MSAFPPQWRERASGFFSTSGVKLKQAGQSAGSFMGEVAKDAADMKERVGSAVKSRWQLFQMSRLRQTELSREAVQERILSAAASTGTLLKKGISETKEKVAVGKVKVEEVAKKTAGKSKNILNNIERWQKGVASNDVFGVPIEVVVQRQESTRPIPQVLVTCANYLVLSGLHTENLFKKEGDKNVMQELISLFNNDWNAPLPDGVSPNDAAALVKCYLASLPEPLTTFVLYDEIRNARNNINEMREILKRLPNVSYTTLEFVTALLLRASQKSSLNKMDAHSLSLELAPVIMWQKGDEKQEHVKYIRSASSSSSEFAGNFTAADYLSDEESSPSSLIPLDDGSPPDYGAIEVIQCLIQHHNAVFTDANVTTWR